MCAELPSTSQQTVVRLAPGVAVLAGQDSHRLLVRLPGLRPDPQQLSVDLTLRHPRAVTVVNLQLKELQGKKRHIQTRISFFKLSLRHISPHLFT